VKLVGDYCAARCISSTYCEVFFCRQSCKNRIRSPGWRETQLLSLFPPFPGKVALYFHLGSRSNCFDASPRMNNPLHNLSPMASDQRNDRKIPDLAICRHCLMPTVQRSQMVSMLFKIRYLHQGSFPASSGEPQFAPPRLIS
jgi:hypothetical protein